MAVGTRTTSQAYGIGSMPLPVGNLTEQPTQEGDRTTVGSSVGEYSCEQDRHVSRLEAIKFCSNPEFCLEEAAHTYMPCDLYEGDKAYQVRLRRSYSSFEPFYTHLRNLIIGTALRKDIQVPTLLTPFWQSFFKNVDLEGHSLQSFSKYIFSRAIDGGCAGIIVEYPNVSTDLTVEEQRIGGYRPYFVAIESCDILGWTSEISAYTLSDDTLYGRRLTSLRIRDEYREIDPKDEFSEIVYPAVRVYDYDGEPESGGKVRYRLFVARNVSDTSESEKTSTQYTLQESGYLSVGIIPFVPTYGGTMEAYMIARPMLLDVARLNLHHWTVAADLANQIHLTANPKFVISGVQGGGADFENSPDKTLILDKPEARANWIGAPMDGAETAMKQLTKLEEAMERLAAVAMMSKTTNQAESGFSKLLDRAQSDSLLAVLVQELEDSVNLAIAIAAEYADEPLTTVAYSKDFVPIRLHSQQLLAYEEIRKNGGMSLETFLHVLEAGDIYDGLADFDIKKEMTLIEGDKKKAMEEARVMEGPPPSTNGQPVTTNSTGGRRRRESSEMTNEIQEARRPTRPS